MLFLIIILPLFSTIIILTFANMLGTKGSIFISCLNIFIAFLLGILSFFFCALAGKIYLIEIGYWINIFYLKLSWIFLFDSLTFVMLIVVLTVSMMVHFYSVSYMETDPHLPRFMSYLSLFTFFMLILVTANNFIQLFLGWEGVGLCSYLLINFWYTRLQANKSAIKALVINRMGDFAILIAISIIYYATYSFDYAVVFSLLSHKVNVFIIFCNIKWSLLNIICFFLFIGAVGKSAQLGLHMWLPDAMEGPTPVSALIHAATMVTAGIFLIIRCSVLFDLSPDILFLVVVVGAATAIFSSTIGMFQHDIKKIIAYSTCSQLGYMVLACGLSNYIIGLYHLTTHAFFKALLFLSAGVIIHAMSDEQDLRKYGGLKNLLPVTYSVLVVGSLALMGFPFLAGFFSKDIILELSYNTYKFNGLLVSWLMSCATCLTAFYSFRVFYLAFLGYPNGFRTSYIAISEGSNIMIGVLSFLTVGSVLFGYLFEEIFTGIGNSFFSGTIVMYNMSDHSYDVEYMGWWWKNLPLHISVSGFLITVFIYYFIQEQKIRRTGTFYFQYTLYTMGVRKWFIDLFSNEFLAGPFFILAYRMVFIIIDRGFLEIFGPTGIAESVYKGSKSLILEHDVDIVKYLRIGFLSFFIFCFYFIGF